MQMLVSCPPSLPEWTDPLAGPSAPVPLAQHPVAPSTYVLTPRVNGLPPASTCARATDGTTPCGASCQSIQGLRSHILVISVLAQAFLRSGCPCVFTQPGGHQPLYRLHTLSSISHRCCPWRCHQPLMLVLQHCISIPAPPLQPPSRCFFKCPITMCLYVSSLMYTTIIDFISFAWYVSAIVLSALKLCNRITACSFFFK